MRHPRAAGPRWPPDRARRVTAERRRAARTACRVGLLDLEAGPRLRLSGHYVVRDPEHGSYSVCLETNKRRYVSMWDAEQVMAQLLLYGPAWQVPCRAYPCDFCEGWHLSSRPRPA